MKTLMHVGEVSTMPRRAYSYKRVSDRKQRKGDGLDRQADFAARICERNGWTLDDTLRFTDRGRSGYHGDHRRGKGQLLQFLEMMNSGRISKGSVLIIENLDRLSREELDEAHDLFKSILRADIWIATEMPERVYSPESLKTLLGTIEPLLHMYVAHEASQKLAERIKDKWERRRARAQLEGRPIGRKCPGWLRLAGGGYEIIPDGLETVRTMFRLAREGMGAGRITQWLRAHADKHPAWGKGLWLRATVRNILRGRAVLGEWQPRQGRNGYRMKNVGDPVRSYYPAVITEEEWQLAQAAVEGRKLARGRPGEHEANLFTGLVYEGISHERMSVKPIQGGPKNARRTYRYLVASRLGEDAKSGRGTAYPAFERAMLRTLGQLRPRDVLPPSKARDELELRIAALTTRLPALDYRKRQLQADAADPDKDYLLPVLAQVVKEIKATAKELDRLKLESTTGRAEALAEVQSTIDLLEKVRGTDQEEDIRRRVKAAIGWLVDSIWIVVQRFNQLRAIVHVQIYLRAGGRPRYVAYGPATLRPKENPWDLSDYDFRSGELPGYVVGQATIAAIA